MVVVVAGVVDDDTVSGAFVVEGGALVVLVTAVVDEPDGAATLAPQPAITMLATRISAPRTGLLRAAR